jgi:hypothetical protein
MFITLLSFDGFFWSDYSIKLSFILHFPFVSSSIWEEEITQLRFIGSISQLY